MVQLCRWWYFPLQQLFFLTTLRAKFGQFLQNTAFTQDPHHNLESGEKSLVRFNSSNKQYCSLPDKNFKDIFKNSASGVRKVFLACEPLQDWHLTCFLTLPSVEGLEIRYFCLHHEPRTPHFGFWFILCVSRFTIKKLEPKSDWVVIRLVKFMP